jgi:hypothetical protein
MQLYAIIKDTTILLMCIYVCIAAPMTRITLFDVMTTDYEREKQFLGRCIAAVKWLPQSQINLGAVDSAGKTFKVSNITGYYVVFFCDHVTMKQIFVNQ